MYYLHVSVVLEPQKSLMIRRRRSVGDKVSVLDFLSP